MQNDDEEEDEPTSSTANGDTRNIVRAPIANGWAQNPAERASFASPPRTVLCASSEDKRLVLLADDGRGDQTPATTVSIPASLVGLVSFFDSFVSISDERYSSELDVFAKNPLLASCSSLFNAQPLQFPN